MDIVKLKIIETSILLIVYFTLKWLTYRLVDNTASKHLIQKTRGKIVKKTIDLILLILIFIFILIIWGVDQSELALFLGSVLTVIGIALFAQWSILSNITSGIILFFNHPVKLDDTIMILDKDYQIEGRVSDITMFFVILKTEVGAEISIPSNVFIQKVIKKIK